MNPPRHIRSPGNRGTTGLRARRTARPPHPGWFAGLFIFALAGTLAAADAAPARLVASTEPGWPQFRGPRRDGISTERSLLPSWPAGGPRAIWSATNLGTGFSSPVISDSRLVITGDLGPHLVLHAFNLDGELLWRATNGAAWKSDYPGARSTPTFFGGRLYHQNAHGRLACLDPATGREFWSVDVLQQFEGSNITWGMSECVAADETAVYVTAGGRRGLVVALNRTNGTVLWKSEPLHESTGEKRLENASYASPILVDFNERRLLVGASLRHVYCIDTATGRLQWTQPMRTSYSVLAMMPALVGDAIFMTAPHGSGGRLWTLTHAAGTIGASEHWRTTLDTCQGGVVLDNGRIYGSFYPGRKGWAAVDAATGQVLYQSGDHVKGAVLLADQRLYALCEDGWMLLLEPAADRFVVHGRFRLADATARDAWAHPVILNGRLYLRHHHTLTAFDIRRDG